MQQLLLPMFLLMYGSLTLVNVASFLFLVSCASTHSPEVVHTGAMTCGVGMIINRGRELEVFHK